MEPKVAALIQISLSSYRHELLVDNFMGVPILQQHGRDDDNVPTYHSRRLSQLIFESGLPSQYVELPGKGHWFDGIMTTEPLRRFYNVSNISGSDTVMPRRFGFAVPSSGDMGSRSGIFVDQLQSPDQLGKIEVSISEDSLTWALNTSNIHRFHFTSTVFRGVLPTSVEIDRQIFSTGQKSRRSWYTQGRTDVWTVGISHKPCLIDLTLAGFR
jgi:hypothetical protein